MTDQPTLTSAQVQEQRETLTARLKTAQGEHVRLAYLAATQEGYSDACATAKGEVDTLEAALAHLATVQVGALQAEQAAREAERLRDRDKLRDEADDAAGNAMVLAARIDDILSDLTETWARFENAWDAHNESVDQLSCRRENIDAIRNAYSRQNVMREHIAVILSRGGLKLPAGDVTALSMTGSFARGTDDRMTHTRRVARTLSAEFPGQGKYAPAAGAWS